MIPDAGYLRHGFAQISGQLRAGELDPSQPTRWTTDIHLAALRAILARAPRTAWPRLATAFNEDQIESKIWLVEHLERAADLGASRVAILGAWYGVLGLIMDQLMLRPPAEVLCIDIDEAACGIAKQLLSVLSLRNEVRHADMLEIDYVELGVGRTTVFINTSCEHLANFSGWRARVPAGAHLVLQSNNHLGCPEHVNCVADLDAFERQASLSHIDYRGTLQLKRFDRFMLIGRS